MGVRGDELIPVVGRVSYASLRGSVSLQGLSDGGFMLLD